MQLVHFQVIKNGEGFRRGRILKHFLMDVDFKNPVRVRVREEGGGRREEIGGRRREEEGGGRRREEGGASFVF